MTGSDHKHAVRKDTPEWWGVLAMSFIAAFIFALYLVAPLLVNVTGYNLWWLLYILLPGSIWAVEPSLLICWRRPPPLSEQRIRGALWWVWRKNLPWPEEGDSIPRFNRGYLLASVKGFFFMLVDCAG